MTGSSGDENNFFNPDKILGNVIDSYTQFLTGGLVGTKNGGIKAGVTGNVAIDGVKEVTGAKAAEEANMMARKQFEQQKVDAAAARVEQQQQNARDQIVQSRLAGPKRSVVPGARVTPQTSNILGGDEQDFLGL